MKLQLLPEKQHKVKTRVMRRTLNPVYDEDFTFYGVHFNQLPVSFLMFQTKNIISKLIMKLNASVAYLALTSAYNECCWTANNQGYEIFERKPNVALINYATMTTIFCKILSTKIYCHVCIKSFHLRTYTFHFKSLDMTTGFLRKASIIKILYRA